MKPMQFICVTYKYINTDSDDDVTVSRPFIIIGLFLKIESDFLLPFFIFLIKQLVILVIVSICLCIFFLSEFYMLIISLPDYSWWWQWQLSTLPRKILCVRL
jgi:hypothetical protein